MTANHALQRTRSAVTLAASCRHLSPATQPARQLRESLSLGSLGCKENNMKPYVSLITLGVDSIQRSREFYEGVLRVLFSFHSVFLSLSRATFPPPRSQRASSASR
jgi:hypothetical protein